MTEDDAALLDAMRTAIEDHLLAEIVAERLREIEGKISISLPIEAWSGWDDD